MSDTTPPPRRRIAGETTTPAPAKKAVPAKKAAAEKAPAKKSPVKKSPVKKTAVSKTAVKKAPAKKSAVTNAAPSPVKKAPLKPASSPRIPAPAVLDKPASAAVTPQVARPQPRTSAPARSRAGMLVVAVAVLALIGSVAVIALGLRNFGGTSFDDAQSSAVSTASAATETIFSFSYDALDEHTTQSKAVMTPSFAKQFDAIVPALTDVAPDRKVQVVAVTRNAAALPCGDECSTDKVSVLVFVDQDRRLADDETATVFGNRIVVEMVKVDGDWKVDDIRAL